jgi:hypothetical protein
VAGAAERTEMHAKQIRASVKAGPAHGDCTVQLI